MSTGALLQLFHLSSLLPLRPSLTSWATPFLPNTAFPMLEPTSWSIHKYSSEFSTVPLSGGIPGISVHMFPTTHAHIHSCINGCAHALRQASSKTSCIIDFTYLLMSVAKLHFFRSILQPCVQEMLHTYHSRPATK